MNKYGSKPRDNPQRGTLTEDEEFCAAMTVIYSTPREIVRRRAPSLYRLLYPEDEEER